MFLHVQKEKKKKYFRLNIHIIAVFQPKLTNALNSYLDPTLAYERTRVHEILIISKIGTGKFYIGVMKIEFVERLKIHSISQYHQTIALARFSFQQPLQLHRF